MTTPQSKSGASYGFNLETLTCGGGFNKLISAFDFGSDQPSLGKSVGEETYNVHWDANKQRKEGLTGLVTSAFQCDPRTCIRSNVRVATKGAEPCDPEVCREVYFCEVCARCPRHCDCHIKDDQSICESAEVSSQVDSYKMGKNRWFFMVFQKKRSTLLVYINWGMSFGRVNRVTAFRETIFFSEGSWYSSIKIQSILELLLAGRVVMEIHKIATNFAKQQISSSISAALHKPILLQP